MKQWNSVMVLNLAHDRRGSSGCRSFRSPKNKFTIRYYFLGDKYPNIYFSHREAQLMVLLLKRKTFAQAAKTLNLSIRTIKFYVTKMQWKTKSHNVAELIKKVRKSDFLHYVDFED